MRESQIYIYEYMRICIIIHNLWGIRKAKTDFKKSKHARKDKKKKNKTNKQKENTPMRKELSSKL